MIRLKLYGQPNWDFEFLKLHLLKLEKQTGIVLNLEEITDWETILKEGLVSIPSVKVNNQELSRTVKESINHFIKKVNLSIMKAENYGNMPQIIVPTDFSKNARKAYLYALYLAKASNAIVKVVYVHYPYNDAINNTRLASEQEQKMRDKLDLFVTVDQNYWKNEAVNAPLVEANFQIGFPIEEIVAFSQKTSNSIIVMGTSGAGNAFKNRYGSVSTEIAQEAECPVILIPPDADDFEFKHIVYAADDLDADIEAAGFLATFAKSVQAKISVAHVENNKVYDHNTLLGHWGVEHPSVAVDYNSVKHESPIEGLQAFCEEKQANLLAMTRRKRTFFRRLFHHSLTTESAVHTKLPLIIIHQKE